MEDKMNILQPNYMGAELENSGIESLIGNYGYGVPEMKKANQKAVEDRSMMPNPAVDNLRRQKARQFGLTKETVGF